MLHWHKCDQTLNHHNRACVIVHKSHDDDCDYDSSKQLFTSESVQQVDLLPRKLQQVIADIGVGNFFKVGEHKYTSKKKR